MTALWQNLLDLGVAPEAIGCLHSKPHQGPPVTDDADHKQILLVTHERLQGGHRTMPEYSRYKGRPRSLVIYDESLIATRHWVLSTRALVKMIEACTGTWERLQETPSPETKAAYGYLNEVAERALQEMDQQTEEIGRAHV
jgi:hypothetical protein